MREVRHLSGDPSNPPIRVYRRATLMNTALTRRNFTVVGGEERRLAQAWEWGFVVSVARFD